MGVESNISASYKMILLQIYPVGSIYESINNNDPNEFIGGTWVRLGSGRMFIGAGSSYSIASEGGESDHALNGNEIPVHSHKVGLAQYSTKNGIVNSSTRGLDYSQDRNVYITTGSTGNSVPHENMPPYVVYYAWERTA